ncbi:MAG: ABC transporter ATP-binding protein [Deltaproteobacteria bacterium]|nr:ABC transporter ATP-binding protein [Deltaproteobacteria bacterium]
MSAIELKVLTKCFPSRDGKGDVTAVDRVSLSVRAGEFVCLLGPSGCGKTTALRCLAGFEQPTSGGIFVGGRDITRVPAHRRNLPLVFQNYALFPHLTVSDNIAYGLRLKKIPAAERTRQVAAVMERLDLQGLGQRHPDQLSGGQQQRVALARALVLQPAVMLFDEPLCNLDAKLRAPAEIYTRPVNRFVADFIGRANFVDGTIVRTESGQCTVRALGTTVQAGLPNGATLAAGDRVTLMIRHEAIIPATGGATAFAGRVNQTIYLGDQALYELTVGGHTLYMQVANPEPASLDTRGATLDLAIHSNGCIVLPMQ